MAHNRSTTGDKDSDQRTSINDEDIPELSPVQPEPLDETAQRRYESPSAELERVEEDAKCDVRPTAVETDMSGVSERDEDTRNRFKKPVRRRRSTYRVE